ncbi:unnamed protein product, partial [Rotaria magnacalcarata]
VLFFTFTCDKRAQKITGLARFYRSGYRLPLPQEGKKPRFTAKNDPVFAAWISCNYDVYCPISDGNWTIKSSAKIDIVVIPEEIPLEIGHCRNSDVQIPLNQTITME